MKDKLTTNMDSKKSLNQQLLDNVFELTETIEMNVVLKFSYFNMDYHSTEYVGARFAPYRVKDDKGLYLVKTDIGSNDFNHFFLWEKDIIDNAHMYNSSNNLEGLEYYMSIEQLRNCPINFLKGSVENILSIFELALKEKEENEDIGVDKRYYNHEYVDLGLSVLWATCNIGASKPNEKGEQYAWGEITNIDSKNKGEYKFFDQESKYWEWHYTKYFPEEQFLYETDLGKVCDPIDNRSVLEPMDDVAQMKWGGNWRMPRLYEIDELIEHCEWEWVKIDGVSGYKVTSKVKGYKKNSIFLPATGRVPWNNNIDETYGYYWSSQLVVHHPKRAYSFVFNDKHRFKEMKDRDEGYFIRPVCSSSKWAGITEIKLRKDSKFLYKNEEYNIGIESLKSNDLNYDFFPVNYITKSNNCISLNRNTIIAQNKGVADVVVSCRGVQTSFHVKVTSYKETATECVDLGLSVKWASHNIGALNVEDEGWHSSWGEIDTIYNRYYSKDQMNYIKKVNKEYYITRYCTKKEYGINNKVDNFDKLKLCDDAAYIIIGEGWRIPTEEEFIELKRKCKWEWIETDEFYGYKITSRMRGYENKSIFLPGGHSILDYFEDDDQLDCGCGAYWTSCLDKESPDKAKRLCFDSEEVRIDSWGRHWGCMIRAVCP